MSRNKENVPTTNHQRAKSAKVTLGATGQSDDFFTDSILESDVTRSSRIPTPKRHPIRVELRRGRGSHKPSTNAQPVLRRASTLDNPATKSKDSSLQPAIHIRGSKSPGLVRSNTIATPPRSRINTDFTSPHTDIKSPPPREFTDVYKQIADEEDLAATEGEFSDPEDSWPEDSEDEQIVVIQPQFHPQSRRSLSGTRSRSSRASTPTQHEKESKGEDFVNKQAENMSDVTGMSFLNDMTDQALAAKLTPYDLKIAKDRDKYGTVWPNRKPVAFTKASKYNDRVFTNHGPIGHEPRIPSFTQATRMKPSGAYSDPASRPASQLSDSSMEYSGMRAASRRRDESPIKPLSMGAGDSKSKTKFKFSGNHGFPKPQDALTEQNLKWQNRRRAVQADSARAPSLNSHYSDPVTHPLRSLGARLNSGSDYTDQAARIRQALLGNSKPNQTGGADKSHTTIDWTAAAADVPLPEVDSSLPSPDEEHAPMTSQKPGGSDRSKTLDTDFSGQSIQVSESPPLVLKKSPVGGYPLGRDLKFLTEQAVTTYRLGEIRGRHPEEQPPSHSRSPIPRSSSRSSDRRRGSSHGASTEQVNDGGGSLPDTADQAADARSNSADLFSRFARAASNTPKLSPASINGVKKHEIEPQISAPKSMKQSVDLTTTVNEPAITIGEGEATRGVQTPKISGGWTDTILPNTDRTTKRVSVPAEYIQTPHVGPGGWIGTPAPQDDLKTIKELTPIMEEVPAELTNGFIPGKADEYKQSMEANSAPGKFVGPPNAGEFMSALRSILNGAKTDNVGDNTIASLLDRLPPDDEECTELSGVSDEGEGRPGFERAREDSKVLDNLCKGFWDLVNSIRIASEGIGRLEQNISQPSSPQPSDSMPLTTCATCNRTFGVDLDHTHEGQLLPTTPLHITIPLPILFRTPSTFPPSKSRILGIQIPQLTPLGYVTFGIWLWYLIECTLSELYSHPTHAEYYIWPSSHLSEPEFPFVLPTMLSRWLKLNNLKVVAVFVFGWLFTLLRASTRALGIWLGWTDGFFDSTSVMNKVAKTVTGTTAAAVGIETDISMMHDEFI